ncbi:DUF4870 domain-containing protein [Xanthomonas albilineans]|uniref:DUF4870 domain-containing protein n=1 Tax=Xanthomonas albilineans (strain GPE PC73 / CFBP 7063) TaxID=380358 RepID=D2UF50_XANAP|nr:DUF4870 domain-containing protein [Xanthomonas albilineans]PPU93600.1 DUF4870 domain-containing protein [Xanthomonas albilineans]QHQ29172.1 hypothetical protein XaFJ1_GM002457 [Xanthomonas albilineans]CBA16934.1 hypothetical protein XALC_2455 [Xanthomonas albilineans GPE PC73]
MSEFDNMTAPPPPPTSSGSKDDRTIALMIHLSGIFVSFVVPLIVWLLYKDTPGKAFLSDQAKEALNFQITIAIGYLICSVFIIILIGLVGMKILWVLNLVFCILAAIKANEGVAYRYPFALRLIK